MKRIKLLIGISICLCGLLLISALANGQASASSLTYNDFSLMFKQSAGQYFSGNVASGQWTWRPSSANASDISWGDPKSWPPTSAEHFIHVGNWVELDGYSKGQGQPVTSVQRVTSETMGSYNCTGMKPIPYDGGRQHYALWNTPASGCCLDAKGTITVGKSVVHFEHIQQWSAPAPCSNAYLKNQVCISQHEKWFDDNGHKFGLQIDRTQYLAKGLGMAFAIRQTYPSKWNADMPANRHWLWS